MNPTTEHPPAEEGCLTAFWPELVAAAVLVILIFILLILAAVTR